MRYYNIVVKCLLWLLGSRVVLMEGICANVVGEGHTRFTILFWRWFLVSRFYSNGHRFLAIFEASKRKAILFGERCLISRTKKPFPHVEA